MTTETHPSINFTHYLDTLSNQTNQSTNTVVTMFNEHNPPPLNTTMIWC